MFIFKEKPKDFPNDDIISCIYVIYKDEILFLKYGNAKSKNNVGKWTIVSGKNEIHENEIECALRELKEETGIISNEKELVFIDSYYYKGNVNRKVYDYYLKLSIKPHIILSDEHTEFRWVKREDINRLELVRGRVEIIQFSKLNWFK